MSGLDISVSGLMAQSRKVDNIARNIANINNNNAGGANFIPVDSVTLSRQNGGVSTADVATPNAGLEDQLVGLNEAKTSFEANAKVIKAQDDMDKALLDIIA